MRRKTADRSLARRAKDLVRRWQQLVANQASSFSVSTSNPSVGEIDRVASSGSLADSGCRNQPTNGVRPLPNRSSVSPQCRLPANDSTSIEKQSSGFRAAEVSSSKYQPSQGKISSLALNSLVRSQPSTHITAGYFQSSTPSSHPATPSSLHPSTPSPQMTSTSAAKSRQAGVAGDATSGDSPPAYLHCMTNGTKPETGVDRAGPSSSMRPSGGSTDALCDVKRKYSNGHNGMLKASSSSSNLLCNGTWSVHCNADRNSEATTGRIASSPDLQQADAPLARLKIKINRTSATGSISSPVASSVQAATPTSTAARKTPKVATTAELIQRLHANGELRLVASETLNRIATNQIEHEADDSNVSIVPEGAKPRPHKRRRTDLGLPDHLPPAMTDSDLLQVKAERVRSFVQMSADASSSAAGGRDNDLLGLLGRLPAPTSTAMTDDVMPMPPGLDAERTVTVPTDVEMSSRLPELPSLDDFEIDWDSNTYTVVDMRPAPTVSDVDRLLTEQWPSVSGQFDHCGQWTDWTQSYSAPGYDGSLLHILPYVDIDD